MRKQQLHYLRNLCILAIFICFTGYGLKAQNSRRNLRNMGSGLNSTVTCSCTDSIGNVYAVTRRGFDTTYVNRWNVASQTWSVYATLSKFVTTNWNSCNVLYGKFYLTGQNTNNNFSYFMEYSGSWKTVAKFTYSPFALVPMNSIKFKNRLYFVGGFDTIGGAYLPNVAVFDGSTFSNAGIPGTYLSNGYFYSSMDMINNDTLFLTAGNKILRHTAPSSWSTYYTQKDLQVIDQLAISNNMVYASIGTKVLQISNGVKMDSVMIPKADYYLNMTGFQNMIYIAERSYTSSSTVYSLNNKLKVGFVFRNQVNDSNKISLVRSSNKLYYMGRAGVIVKGVNYNNIAEVLVDSILPVGFDTITGTVFWDKNNNYKKDGNDKVPTYGYLENLTGNYTVSLGVNTGTFVDIVEDDLNAEYGKIFTQYDSCVQVKFSGNLIANNTAQGITSDSLDFPMVRQSTQNLNLVLKNQSGSRARLLDTIPLFINVRNKDCAVTSKTGSVKVTLDTGVTLITTIPAYTSKVGNVVTFSGLNFNYQTDNLVKLFIVYPNTKYNEGDLVRHYAQLGQITGEDTMDNMDSIVQKMVYSYDPNSKHSLPEGKVTKDLNNIRYYIDFQNLGSADAIRVTVVDTLNLKIPVYEFRMVACSHPYKLTIQPGTNIVTWVFNNIYLKPNSQSEEASKGYIIFDARLMKNVRVGDSIRNRAYIYFDYNPPVITNFAVINRVEPPVAVKRIDRISTKSLRAYPNPAQDLIQIENTTLDNQNIVIYDLKGALVAAFKLKGKELISLQVEHWAKGMFVLKNDRGESCKLIVD